MKQLFVCKLARPLLAARPTTGRQPMVVPRRQRHRSWRLQRDLIDVPGANPSQLVLAWVKMAMLIWLTVTTLGGSPPVAQLPVEATLRGQSSATYTRQGTYFVFRAGAVAKLRPIRLLQQSADYCSPRGMPARTARVRHGLQPPMVQITRSYGLSVPRVTTRLHGYNGDTGAVVYAGGGANELMTGDRKWNSGMVARGSIYVQRQQSL